MDLNQRIIDPVYCVMDKHYSFKPIIDQRSQVLILGTLPGPESLRMGEYYANPNNQFWRIIYRVFDEEYAGLAYDERIRFLRTHRIALWDVFRSAVRKGALDSDIRSEEPNDIPGLLLDHPGLIHILLAGRKAERSFRIHFPDFAVDAVYVPSTSPAYAKRTFENKVYNWKSAIAAVL